MDPQDQKCTYLFQASQIGDNAGTKAQKLCRIHVLDEFSSSQVATETGRTAFAELVNGKMHVRCGK